MIITISRFIDLLIDSEIVIITKTGAKEIVLTLKIKTRIKGFNLDIGMKAVTRE